MDKPQNKALERPLALIREKTQEYQELTRINKQSEQLAQYFEELAKNMQDLASGVQGTHCLPMTRNRIHFLLFQA